MAISPAANEGVVMLAPLAVVLDCAATEKGGVPAIEPKPKTLYPKLISQPHPSFAASVVKNSLIPSSRAAPV